MTNHPIEAAAITGIRREVPDQPAREEILRGVFADVLGVAEVGADDNFYDLGGHSLLVVKLVRRIRRAFDADVGVDEIFDNPTPAAAASLLAAKTGSHAGPAAGPRPAVVPLSPGQQRLWYLDRLEVANGAYNIPVVLRLSGSLDIAALRQALRDTVARHEALRTVISEEIDGEPSQKVLPPAAAALPFEHVASTPDRLAAALAHDAGYVFDLRRELPVRAWLHTVGARQHSLMILLHHIAADGGSIGPLCRDLAEAYAARCAGQAPSWAPLALQYADYTLWHRRLLGDADDPDSLASRQLSYWREALAGLPEEITLPADRPGRAAGSGAEGLATATVDARVRGDLAELARAEGLTMFMIAQAAAAVALHLGGAGDDIPLGTPVEGRRDAALEPLVGFFVNTIVLRTVLSGDPSLSDVLRQVRGTALAAYANQELPFDQLVEELNPARLTGRLPLYQVSIAWTQADQDLPPMNGLRCELGDAGLAPAAKVPLAFGFVDRPGSGEQAAELAVEVTYDSALFDHSTAVRLAESAAALLAAFADQPSTRLSALATTTAGDHAKASINHAAPAPAVSPHVAPGTELEKAIAGVWGEVLHLERVGLHDNFFALGGSSIDSLRIVIRLAKLGINLAPKDLLEHQTIGKLTAAIPACGAAASGAAASGAEPARGAEHGPAPATPAFTTRRARHPALSEADAATIAERFG